MKGLRLLLWKNFRIESRNKVHFLIELFGPVIFAIFFVATRFAMKVEKQTQPHIYEAFNLKGNVPPVVRDCCDIIYYTPINSVTDQLVKTIKTEFFQKEGLEYVFQGFSRKNELERSYMESVTGFSGNLTAGSSPVLGGLIFENLGNSKRLPHEIKYTIRLPSFQRTTYEPFRDRGNFNPSWYTSAHYSFFLTSGPRSRDSQFGGYPGYYDEGFLYLQYAVDTSIAKFLLNDTQAEKVYDQVRVKLQRFPFPPYSDDVFLSLLNMWLPFLLAMAYIYPVMNITRQVVHEKSSRLKEFMKILGLPNYLHWTGWIVTFMTTLTLSAIIAIILLKIRVRDDSAIFTHTNPLILFIIFVALSWTVIGYSFLFSSLFSNGETASTVAAFVWLMHYMSFIKLFTVYPSLSFLGKLGYTILWSPNMSTFLSFYILFAQENDEVGGQWSNFWDGVNITDDFSVGHTVIISFLNGSLYMIFAFYIELVFPGEFGVPLPWYFPLTPSYWFGSPQVTENEQGQSKNQDPGRSKVKGRRGTNYRPAVVEKESPNLKAGVEITGLFKVFGSKIAVNNLNLKMYEGQVTSLLGHNGAGKTTTMSILTGMITPSGGSALVNSFDIRKDMTNARASLGLCPQYNVLFDNLTVEEHLRFFSILKGYGVAETIEEVERMLDVLGLHDKRTAQSRTLSGGMKRKLSVGIAFSAGSKVVLLDEPTAGMDVKARRSTWDLIQAEKKDRTVILSTHYMQEADVLGDRIAIMAEGQLQCCGSPLFLKSKYGGDYNLTIVKQPNCDLDLVIKTIERIIPTAFFSRSSGAEVSCTLPVAHVEKFSVLFDELDERKDELGIGSYGVGSTSMEDIFMRVGDAAEDHKRRGRGLKNRRLLLQKSQSTTSFSSSLFDPVTQSSQVTLYNQEEDVDKALNTGLTLLLQQMSAMFLKKFLSVIRNIRVISLQIVIPCLILLFGISICNTVPSLKRSEPLTFEFDEFDMLDESVFLLNCDVGSSIMCQKMNELARVNGFKIQKVDSILTTLQDKGEKSITKLVGDHMLGFAEEKGEVTAFFNNQPLHLPPMALNFVTNSLLSSFGLSHRIQVTNDPFDYTPLDEIKAPGNTFNSGYVTGIMMPFAVAFVSSSFVIGPIQERMSGSKHLQVIAGVRMFIYWLPSFLIDGLIMILSAMALLIPIASFDNPEFDDWGMRVRLVFIVSTFGWCMILLAMFVSTIATSPATAYARLCALTIVTGCITVFCAVVTKCPEFKLMDYHDTIYWLGMFAPSGCMALGIMDMGQHFRLRNFCKFMDLDLFCVENPHSDCCIKLQDSFFSWKAFGIGRHFILFIISSLCFLVILIIQESEILREFKGRLAKKLTQFGRRHGNRKFSVAAGGGGAGCSSTVTNGSMEMMDADVVKENKRINKSTVTSLSLTDNLVLKNVTKVYKNSMMAVDGLTVGVKKGEIFGLLGINGAGKTTTFQMLTGNIPITSGDAYVSSYSVKSNLRKAHSFMGYCPQFDSTIDQLTGREMMIIFARLKGIKEQNIGGVTQVIAETLLFQQFLDKQTGTYSGGNKRKLSTALAFLGWPSVLLLDEPTARMDPVARRHVWNAISSIRETLGSSVIISSHNMEECDALCSKLGIMVQGRFECLGSPQHLKSKLCQGYTLMAQLSVDTSNQNDPDEMTIETMSTSSSSVDTLALDQLDSSWDGIFRDFCRFMETKFPGCSLKDVHSGFVQFQLPSENMPWSKIFARLEEAKRTFPIETYSINQVNLEDVFFNFVQSAQT